MRSRLVGASLAIAGVLSATPSPVRGAAGDLDPSYGANGRVVTSLASTEDRANAAVLQPDGKLLAGGGLFTASGADFAVVRYLPSGVPDPAFGTGGVSTTAVGGYAEIVSIALQPDGRIVALGNTSTGSGYDTVLVRYLADGTPDPTFGTAGVVVSTIGPGRGYAWSVLVRPDGKLVTVGYADPAPRTFALAQFEADGTVDAAFGVAGEVLDPLAGADNLASGATLLPDGRIVVGGTTFGGGPGIEWTLARYLADGTRDGTFGTGGVVETAGPQYSAGITAEPDGKLVMIGSTNTGTDYDFTVARYEADGALDATFGVGGIVYTPVGAGNEFAYDVVVQPNGNIVVVGEVDTGVFIFSDFGVVRYLPDGSLDAAFGTGGITRTPFGNFAGAVPNAVVRQADARLVAVGSLTNAGPRDFALARWFGGDCGDGTVEPGEQCDDGNTADGDCCSSRCQYEAAGTACAGDGDACTNDVCDGAGACGHTPVACPLCQTCDAAVGCHDGPRTGCFAPDHSSVALLDRTPDAGDRAIWSWRSAAPGTADFGDPVASDAYAWCVYEGGAATLRLRASMPMGDICRTRFCWMPIGSDVVRYRDPDRTPDGVASMVLRAGTSSGTRIALKGKGPLLGLSPLGPLATPVRVQLQRTGGTCWEASYPTASANGPGRFQATAR